jgi:hypothetical protein
VLGTCSLLLDHNEAQSITICDGVLLGVALSTIAAFMQRGLAREGMTLLSGHADHADEAALRGAGRFGGVERSRLTARQATSWMIECAARVAQDRSFAKLVETSQKR